jgi:hypothetical protein
VGIFVHIAKVMKLIFCQILGTLFLGGKHVTIPIHGHTKRIFEQREK